MTQPWSEWEPQLNDYTGYALASGRYVSSAQSRPRQLAIGAPRACTARNAVDGWPASVCADRAGTVFVVEYKVQGFWSRSDSSHKMIDPTFNFLHI